MTEQITVPRATWDALREALELVHSKLSGNVNGADEHCFTISMKNQISYSQMCRISEAITAANAVSHPQATEPAEWKLVPVIPTEEQWGGLARDIMMWLDMDGRKTAGSLFKHLERCGTSIPQWLRDEPEMKNLDHVPSKGTRITIIYRAMLAPAPEAP